MKKVLSLKSIFKPAWLELTAEEKARISAEVDHHRNYVEKGISGTDYSPSDSDIDKATLMVAEVQKILDPYIKIEKALKKGNFKAALRDGWARNPNGPSAYANKVMQLNGMAMK